MIIYFNIILFRIVQVFNKYKLQYRKKNIFSDYKESFFLLDVKTKKNETSFLKKENFTQFKIKLFNSAKYIIIVVFKLSEKGLQKPKSNTIYNTTTSNLIVNYYRSG